MPKDFSRTVSKLGSRIVMSIDLRPAEFTKRFPGDESGDTTSRQTPDFFWCRVEPRSPSRPRLGGWSKRAAEELQLPYQSAHFEEDLLTHFSGERVPRNLTPYAARYGGYQFGHWAGQLGDGRAITLGELESRDGTWQEVQLKGAGRTPYSRFADGLAVLRSTVREFICSEAMIHLGVPSSGALCFVETGDQVLRDMFYDGRAAFEPGAVLTRYARSFIRFGHFDLLASEGNLPMLEKLLSYVLELEGFASCELTQANLRLFFTKLCCKTAELIGQWFRVGFVHGVLNTDNMSIHGLTIDFGPYGWLDIYDPKWTPNTSDPHARYGFEQQAA